MTRWTSPGDYSLRMHLYAPLICLAAAVLFALEGLYGSRWGFLVAGLLLVLFVRSTLQYRNARRRG